MKNQDKVAESLDKSTKSSNSQVASEDEKNNPSIFSSRGSILQNRALLKPISLKSKVR